MSGVLKLPVRAAILFAIVLFGLIAFAATRTATGDDLPRGDSPEITLAAGTNLDTPESVASIPDQSAVEMRNDPAGTDSESGLMFLIILGLGAVAIALRRRVDRVLHQFA